MAKVTIASLLSYELPYTLWNMTAQFKSSHEAIKCRHKTIQKDGEAKSEQVMLWVWGGEGVKLLSAALKKTQKFSKFLLATVTVIYLDVKISFFCWQVTDDSSANSQWFVHCGF